MKSFLKKPIPSLFKLDNTLTACKASAGPEKNSTLKTKQGNKQKATWTKRITQELHFVGSLTICKDIL